jgi:hypothetical protein
MLIGLVYLDMSWHKDFDINKHVLLRPSNFFCRLSFIVNIMANSNGNIIFICKRCNNYYW